jgi:hypothetical protein
MRRGDSRGEVLGPDGSPAPTTATFAARMGWTADLSDVRCTDGGVWGGDNSRGRMMGGWYTVEREQIDPMNQGSDR